MRIVIINPPHESIGSRMPGEMLPPLGLLAIGGPLIDDGHDVSLIDGDIDNTPLDELVAEVTERHPQCVLIGHNGSTSAHPIVVCLLRMLRLKLERSIFIYGGVFPTYHWRECLNECPEVDFIVRGEGEETTRRLLRLLESGASEHGGRPQLNDVGFTELAGIAFRKSGVPSSNPPAAMIENLDNYRVGWELIDHSRYTYYGGRRGVVVQFSRGCPHLCTYCGQRGYWTRWRHRDPKKFAAELGRLYRQCGVTMISFADENPTTSKKVWRELLDAIIAENCNFTMIATVRADDIVRDADILHLYREAGFARFLIGMEHTDALTLEKVRKGGATKTDRQAIILLRRAGILSLCSYVVGFDNETDMDYYRALRQLIAYDPDQIITLYVTPHRWTPYFREAEGRRVIQTDQKRWDYKNQVLENKHMSPWRTFIWVKVIEVLVQIRPKALFRTYRHPDPSSRSGMRWYARIGRRVWLHEIWWFMTRDRFAKNGPTLSQFWGEPQDAEQNALQVRQRNKLTKAA